MFYFTSLIALGLAVYYSFLVPTAVLPVADIYHLAQRHTKSASSDPLQGKLAIVTGATSGLGFEIAAELFKLGSIVILASRSSEKLATTKVKIEKLHPKSKGQLETHTLDTSDLNSINSFCDHIIADGRGINYLINNAGINYITDGSHLNLSVITVSAQGYDLAFATNYLGHFLLTERLLPLLIKGGSETISKILNVASTFHFNSDAKMLVLDNSLGGIPGAASAQLSATSIAHRTDSYSNNKLAQVLHAKHLNKLLIKRGVSQVRFLSFCPGFVATGIFPKGVIGSILSSKAFTPNAGIVGALFGLFDDSIPGGSFVTSFTNFWVEQSWSSALLRILKNSGLWGTPVVTGLFCAWILLFQGASYGARVSTSSPESYDEKLAENLYDWSLMAVKDCIESKCTSINSA